MNVSFQAETIEQYEEYCEDAEHIRTYFGLVGQLQQMSDNRAIWCVAVRG
jgi:hypothetical protein